MNQQATPYKYDPNQLPSQHLKDDRSSHQDDLCYKNFAGYLIFGLLVACISLAVIYEP
jgi:hypothetical protein